MKSTHVLLLGMLTLLVGCGSPKSQQNENQNSMKEKVAANVYAELDAYIKEVKTSMAAIPKERKESLNEIASYISQQQSSGEIASLIFICTHNSRRSHMGQIWATTAAHHYGVGDSLQTYSGGTEATAFNPRAVKAIQKAGFRVDDPGGDNPRYQVTFAENAAPMTCFSKKYDDRYNPQENFAAIMTCSQADEACPLIPGASYRVAIPYEDPKVADGTPEEEARYDERCKQVATEMFYVMSQVSQS